METALFLDCFCDSIFLLDLEDEIFDLPDNGLFDLRVVEFELLDEDKDISIIMNDVLFIYIIYTINML